MSGIDEYRVSTKHRRTSERSSPPARSLRTPRSTAVRKGKRHGDLGSLATAWSVSDLATPTAVAGAIVGGSSSWAIVATLGQAASPTLVRRKAQG